MGRNHGRDLSTVADERASRGQHVLVDQRRQGCQFVISSHSPILLAYPNAKIFQLSEEGLAEVAYEQTEHYALTKDFLMDRARYFRTLFDE